MSELTDLDELFAEVSKPWYRYDFPYSFSVLWRLLMNRRPRPVFRARMMWQRARRGYSDEDTWSFDHYLSGVIADGLRDLRGRNLGYPAQLTAEKWDAILAQMIEGFEVAKEDAWDAGNDPRVKEALRLFGRWYFALWD